MIIIVGLGNPGQRFQKTRHNIGFRVVDKFLQENNLPEFKSSKRSNALISNSFLNGTEVIIVKPQTFMNLSGRSIKKLISNFQFLTPNLWIIHDDVDLPLGKIRIVKGRGAAGHKGVESIIKTINSKNFIRFRVGIKPEKFKPKNIEKFVLQKFNKEEGKIVKEIIERTCQAIKFALTQRIEKAMSKFNK